MIRSLRRKFILGAMLAFTILLAVVIAGMTAFGYISMESNAEKFLERKLQESGIPEQKDPSSADAARPTSKEAPPARPADTPPNAKPPRERENAPTQLVFGYTLTSRELPLNHCILIATPEGSLLRIENNGLQDTDSDSLQALALRILEKGSSGSKIDAFKYRAEQQEDGVWKLILLDVSLQARTLLDLLLTTASIGFGSLVVLFFIMLPVSKRIVRTFAANAEKQKQFVTNAGHDIKTPVAIIQSNLDAMELIQGETKWSRNIRSQTNRLTALLQQLLFAARMDERTWSPNVERVDFSAMVGTALNSYTETLQQRRITVRQTIPDSLSLRADRECLRQLLHLLLDNAVSYANEGGTLTVTLERRCSRLYLTLANTVDRLPSVPPSALFDRFYRGDDARTQSSGGCGIGLSSAEAIAKLHRGRIDAFYDSENVVRFVVELPM